MIYITTELAQNIVIKMMDIIPYNINIMNEKGIIIGSGDASRINKSHEGALEALKKERAIEVYDAVKGVKPGINAPILFNNKAIGVVGISGNPDEVRPFSEILRIAVELLINQEYTFTNKTLYERHREEFLYELANRTTPYTKSFIERGLTLEIDVTIPKIAIIFNFEEEVREEIRKTVYNSAQKDEFYTTLNSTNIVIFMKENKSVKKRIDKIIGNLNFKVNIGVGNREEILGISVKQGLQALNIGKKIEADSYIHFYNNLYFVSYLANLKGDKRLSYIIDKLDREGKQASLLNTLVTYINMSGEMNQTAEALHIHRNTLNYRLEKIRDITGKNPKQLLDLFELYISYIITKL
ncbi:transcriptional regulator [Clostridium bovifaecis]|uniref:Transcriptional regulator n=1 Tax=Clostridium bovifaecis TaxID=2184719 RepID=A0A6I6EX95_9CLOT|nr:transcriptional regulator [Clostridium bovifaecis]